MSDLTQKIGALLARGDHTPQEIAQACKCSLRTVKRVRWERSSPKEKQRPRQRADLEGAKRTILQGIHRREREIAMLKDNLKSIEGA